MKFPLREADARFLQNAPWRWQYDAVVPATCGVTFEALCDGDGWPRWFESIKRVEWTTPRPFGVGTTRTVTMQNGLKLDEYFFRWEEGRRYSFYGTAFTLPAMKAIVEDYLLEPHPDGCRFTYTVGVEATMVGKLAALERTLTKTFAPAPESLARYMAAKGA